MPDDTDEEKTKEDEELEELKAELDKERAKQQKKTATPSPKTIEEPVKPKQPEKEEKELEDLKAELERERDKYSVIAKPPITAAQPTQPEKPVSRFSTQPAAKPPMQAPPATYPQTAVSRPTPAPQQPRWVPPQQPKPQPAAAPAPPTPAPKDEDAELEELNAELEKERTKHSIQPPEPEKKPTTTQAIPPTIPQTPAAPPIPAAPKKQGIDLDSIDRELEKDKGELVTKKAPTPAAKPPKPELTPLNKERIARPTLEPLAESQEDIDELIPGAQTRKKPSMKSPLTRILPLIIILAVAVLIVYMFIPKTQTTTSYQCMDGSWVTNQTDCPIPTTLPTTTTETVRTTTTTAPTDTTTTTTVIIFDNACANNAMCERPIPYAPFCEENKYVKTPAVKFTCIHPGAADSYCEAKTVTPRLVKACDNSQYCWMGECYPLNCRNRARDIDQGEKKVDCGGPCKPCTDTDTICYANSDCGKDLCQDPYCNSARNPTQNCTRYICQNPGQPNAMCAKASTIEILEVCTWGKKCVDGQRECWDSRGEANCHNCIQDEGEAGIDCGGPCLPCATKPPAYDSLNLTATALIDYQRYSLKLERLTREDNCSVGAEIRVNDPYGVSKSKKISRFNNTDFYDISFGMISADTNSIRIWITKKIPI